MKTLVLSMLAMASMAAMTSCSSENDVIDEVNPNGNQKVEIKLTAGVVGVQTKAIIGNDATNATAPNQDIPIQLVTKEREVEWTTISTVASSPTFKSDGTLDYTGTNKLYYNADAAINTSIIGYHPLSIPASGIVNWTINGSQDIIIAKEVSGNKDTQIQNPLAFKHLLTQLQFEVKGDAAAIATFGKIKSIKVVDALTKPQITLTSSEITALDWSNTDKSDLAVLDNSTNTAFTAKDLTESYSPVGYLMLQPSSSYKLSIDTDNITGKIINVSINSGALIGTANKIQLSFSATDITPTASLGKWNDGTTTEVPVN